MHASEDMPPPPVFTTATLDEVDIIDLVELLLLLLDFFDIFFLSFREPFPGSCPPADGSSFLDPFVDPFDPLECFDTLSSLFGPLLLSLLT